MKLPKIRGMIDRRILLNYRVDPDVLALQLPAPFRPKLVRGFGLAGICLIRFRELRPAHFPHWLGLSSENAAHRIAVEWDENGTTREGVYILRRDTNSRFHAAAGGRLFQGYHDHAQFGVVETDDAYRISIQSDDRQVRFELNGRRTPRWSGDSVFESLDEASEFFRCGAIGLSRTRSEDRFQQLELCCHNWEMEPLGVEQVRSSFFDDAERFPAGSLQLDCALLMRRIRHEWRGLPDLCCDLENIANRNRSSRSGEAVDVSTHSLTE